MADTKIIPRRARKRQNTDTVRLSLPAEVVEALGIDDEDNVAIIIDEDDETVRLARFSSFLEE